MLARAKVLAAVAQDLGALPDGSDAGALARRRGAAFKPPRRIVIGAVLIGLLSIGVFAAGHHPWSVTFGFTVWGAKLAALAGYDHEIAALRPKQNRLEHSTFPDRFGELV